MQLILPKRIAFDRVCLGGSPSKQTPPRKRFEPIPPQTKLQGSVDKKLPPGLGFVVPGESVGNEQNLMSWLVAHGVNDECSFLEFLGNIAKAISIPPEKYEHKHKNQGN